ncbi:MAG: nucleotidyltransferase domain-containing protein [Sphingobacteriales bacterium]|nr:MAG: nucleotidyltransferase domain-containing protein [Sphingobacteriales bacterium]
MQPSINIENIKTYLKTQPVRKAWLFGSYASGTADDNSDIDILVELDHSQPIGLKFVSMWLDLKEVTKKDVDLLAVGGVSPYIQPYIDKQKVLIYER